MLATTGFIELFKILEAILLRLGASVEWSLIWALGLWCDACQMAAFTGEPVSGGGVCSDTVLPRERR